MEKLEIIIENICNNYCKYPLIWDEEISGPLSNSEICANCPLNELAEDTWHIRLKMKRGPKKVIKITEIDKNNNT